MYMIETAYEVNLTPKELADILYEQAESLGIDLFNQDHTTDLNALLNMYISDKANSNIYEVLDISLSDYDVYFFANYLDCPLQYPFELVEELEQAIKEKEVSRDDFDIYALYVLDEMGVSFDTEEEIEEQ